MKGSNTVSVIDVSTLAVMKTITLDFDSNPRAIAITPDGNYAFVANYGSNTVSVIEVSTLAVKQTITVVALLKESPSHRMVSMSLQ